MFSYIKGRLVAKTDQSIILDNNGIGYDILMPQKTLDGLFPDEKEIQVYVCFQMKDEKIQLFGFLTEEDKELFQLLITVSGVGPKGAVKILSHLPPQELVLAILSEDIKTISKTPGVGEATAKRIAGDLKKKVKNIQGTADQPLELAQEKLMAIEALMSFGYGRAESAAAVVDVPDDMGMEAIIKHGLKNLTRF